jgi:hypothetical protein
MLMMVVEVILTVVAWRKGWRGWALLPMGAIMLVGLVAGLVAGAVGATESQFSHVTVALFPLELVGVGVLVWMAAKGRKRVEREVKVLAPVETPSTESV